MKRKKYFFFDIDGTIAINFPRIVPESTRKTLNQLKENGHFISIATGRMHVMTTEFCKEFEITNMVTDGGKGIVIDGEVNIEVLDHDMMVNLIDELDEKNIPWGICLSDERKWHSRDEVFPNKMHEAAKIRGYMESVINPDIDIRKEKNIYKGFAFLTKDEEKEIEALKNTTYTRYNDNYIIVEHDDKSVGIRKIMEIMDIEDEDIVVFGDNTNDIKMFRPEWTSIAMGNAVDELKEIADFITKAADDDGIEFACRHFGWID